MNIYRLNNPLFCLLKLKYSKQKGGFFILANYYTGGYNPYIQNPYMQQNPMMNQQNRLQALENQFYNQNNNQVQQNNSFILKGRPVTSFDEAKASMIDLDGSVFIFPDFANGKIYTKQVMMDGTAPIKIYELNEPIQQNKNNNFIISEEENKFLKEKVEFLENKIDRLENEVKSYVQSFTTSFPVIESAKSASVNDEYVSGESGDAKSNTNGRWKK